MHACLQKSVSVSVLTHNDLSWKDQICIHENNTVFVLLTNMVDVLRMYSTSCLRQVSAPGLGGFYQYVCKELYTAIFGFVAFLVRFVTGYQPYQFIFCVA